MRIAEDVTTVCWVLSRIAKRLGPKTVEVAMDATYKTNTKQLESYSILAEHDNAGCPPADCFLTTATPPDDEKRTRALAQWMRRLKESDKDMAGDRGITRSMARCENFTLPVASSSSS
ncbi:hypothetical protein HGRIS_001266 [Hohenbuehelia grisea]|uniref:Transposase n=1 Tax=Hohenbuehelia grisea TaxID=104357 RepID=A0ABR3JQC6_9AGAR